MPSCYYMKFPVLTEHLSPSAAHYCIYLSVLHNFCSCSHPSQTSISGSHASSLSPVYSSQHWCTTLTVALLLFHIHWFSWQLLCICPAWWVFLCLSKPSQFHISQNLMSKHLRISSNHGTKSLIISTPPENCILFTASCSWPLSHLLPPSIIIPCGMLK